MVGFSDILDNVYVEDLEMMKDIGKLLVIVNLTIILLHLKLDRFYCIGAMN